MRGKYYTEKGLVRRMRPFSYAQFSRTGKRLRNVTFYARSQEKADEAVTAWAARKGRTIKRRKLASR